MKNEKGITLTSLVIAIIVILILASISVYSGTSIVRYADYNKAKAEIQTIHAQVCKWHDEFLDDDGANNTENETDNVLEYGEKISESNQETKRAIEDTFSEIGVDDENLQANYRFFSEQYLKDTLGLDASFDYLVDIIHRDVILVSGVYYNGKSYFTLNDFGITNVEDYNDSSISFNLEPGNDKEIVISNIKLNLKNNSTQNETTTDISKFIVEYRNVDGDNRNWIDVTKDVVKFEDGEENNKTTKYKFSVDSFGAYDVRVRTTDKKLGDVKDITLEPRPGIKVGDYITYTSPTESVTFTDADTGWDKYATKPEILSAKNSFRVMEIDEEGNMRLMGAMTYSDKIIYFCGAKGYNNVVYTLNKKCSDLYKDTSKGIKARSIKVEDITDKFNQTGKDKLSAYITNQMSSLSSSTSVTKNANNTVTYSNENTDCPDIFQYEVGGLIDSTATKGVIGQSESYSEYNGLTALTNKTPKPISLTVPYTYYYTLHTEEDFDNTKGNATAYQNMFFGTSINFFLASRCIRCNQENAWFGVRFVNNSYFGGYDLYNSDKYNGVPTYRVCPVVYIPSSVEITVSTDDSTYHQSKPHEVK